MNEHTQQPEGVHDSTSYLEKLKQLAHYAEFQVEVLEEEELRYLAERDKEENPLWLRLMASRALRHVRGDLAAMKQMAEQQREMFERANGTWQSKEEEDDL